MSTYVNGFDASGAVEALGDLEWLGEGGPHEQQDVDQLDLVVEARAPEGRLAADRGDVGQALHVLTVGHVVQDATHGAAVPVGDRGHERRVAHVVLVLRAHAMRQQHVHHISPPVGRRVGQG
jgi:hypothetical protein